MFSHIEKHVLYVFKALFSPLNIFEKFKRTKNSCGSRILLMILTKNFGVADDGADLSESLLAGLLHLHMGVSEHLGQLGHDAGQTGG